MRKYLNNILIPRNDRLRHKTLEILTKKIESCSDIDCISEGLLNIPITTIIYKLKVTEEEFYAFTSPLISENEICFSYGESGEKCTRADRNTAASCYTYKYLEKGKDRRIAHAKDYLGITTSLIAIVAAIVSTTTAMLSIGNNQRRIKAIETELQQLKSQQNQSNPHNK